MTCFPMAFAWAAFILGAAIWTQSQGLGDGASFGIIAGLSSAAWGSLHSEFGCGRGCLS
ncbi:MAG: hypothetical protein QNJ15_01125 [Erythrobacter sp.]|nr:hypothetical protein [Erythrobacter sp.]